MISYFFIFLDVFFPIQLGFQKSCCSARVVVSNYWSTLMVARNCLFNSDGSEELPDGGETTEKLSLVFSLFPPLTSIVRRDTVRGGVYNDFEDS